LFTDSDLVRLLERREDSKLDAPIRDVMTLNPLTIHATTTLEEAVRILSERKISELPVIDSEGKPIGIVDITDVIGRMPEIATDPQWACNADPQAAEDSTFEMTRPGR